MIGFDWLSPACDMALPETDDTEMHMMRYHVRESVHLLPIRLGS